jgi:vacuolar-type H+-ATPase subunit E/Vma4
MSGISNIIDIINTKTTEKENEIIQDAERHRRIKLEEAERRASEAADVITKKAELQAKSELSRYDASAKLKSKYQLLNSKEALIEDALKATVQKLDSIVGKAEYKRVLARLAIDGAIALHADTLELVLPKNHTSYLDLAEIETAVSKETKKKTKMSISKENVRSKGGLIIRTPDSKRLVDNTFEARLERLENKARVEIASILFKSDNKE